ncbi:UDP-glycosyltransferase 91C1-like [Primulina huaijiensis]|uniref:UDP-glycosyltransferase 91C1-like n=1 Tax=Primulina huaijiensis TaxID=1492673 RepID=UPI003CC749CD
MADDRKLHIVMFPWLAFGHIIPFLELSEAIARKGHKISFISTPRNIDRLPKLRPNVASSITFVKIPLPLVEGLPENAEATMDIGNEDVDFLKIAHDLMEPAVARFLTNSRADAVVYDFSAHWLPPIAIDLGISRVMFWIFQAWILAWVGKAEGFINGFEGRRRPEEFMIAPEWVTFHTKVAWKYHEAKEILSLREPNGSGFSDGYRAGVALLKSDAIIMRHCNEFDTEWFNLLPNLYPQEVIPIGFLPPHVQETKQDDSETSWISIKEWLDKQTKGSVLYIAFGTEVTPKQDQLDELAHGLELSQVPFLWVFRRPALSRRDDKIHLPEGFEERVKGRGVVWIDWAPQVKILKHDSVGAFLTHCGTTSTFEALMYGLPLVMLPLLADLWMNARILEEKQIGMEIQRNDEDGSFTRDSVAQCIRMVMVEDVGQKFRDKAKEASAVLGEREIHDGYLDKFTEYLLMHKS